MRKSATAVAASALLAVVISPTVTTAVEAADQAMIDEGRQIAFDRKKGNCLACHHISGGDMAGNIGPMLIAMQARYPDRAKLRAQIWDSTHANANSMMPPFGRHEILTESEIDSVVEFVHSL